MTLQENIQIRSLGMDSTTNGGEHHWKFLERENLLRTIDNSTPSKKYLCLISGLDRHQASLIFQLCLGHVGLNQHLFGKEKDEKIHTNSRCNRDLWLTAKKLKSAVRKAVSNKCKQALCYECYCRRYFYQKGSYQVLSDLELKSR